MTKRKPKLGRPPTERGAYNPVPPMQLGRVPEDERNKLRSVTEVTGVPFVRWALPVLLKEADRLLRAARRRGK
jgi:hypothetical protein